MAEESDWRTDDSEVRELLTSEESASISDLDPYIYAAHIIVDYIPSGSYGASHLEQIERWLAAHVASSSYSAEADVEQFKMGDTSVRFRSQTSSQRAEFLAGTRYGRTVMQLDVYNHLCGGRKQGAKIKAW